MSKKTTFILLVLTILFCPCSALGQGSREMLYYGYIKKVFSLIKDGYYKPVEEKQLVQGAFMGIGKVMVGVNIPSGETLADLEAVYFSLCKSYPQSAGKMAESALSSMVDSLQDPYSVLLTPEKKRILEADTGAGIGVELGYKNGAVYIISPILDSPAYQSGLKSGDRIIKINSTDVRAMNLYETSMLISGKNGDKISITVERQGKLLTFTPIFAPLNIEPIKYALLSNNIGYIRINLFNGKIFDKFNSALQKMKEKKVRGLILDLRDNPGGNFEEALRISARFVPSGTLIWIQKKGKEPEAKISGSNQTFPAPVVVLINEGSASASEVLACSLSDNKKAILMGRQSFGKGIVQTEFRLTGGATLNLTTEKYLTPDKKDIHMVGLTPQIIIENSPDSNPTRDAFVITAWKYLNEK